MAVEPSSAYKPSGAGTVPASLCEASETKYLQLNRHGQWRMAITRVVLQLGGLNSSKIEQLAACEGKYGLRELQRYWKHSMTPVPSENLEGKVMDQCSAGFCPLLHNPPALAVGILPSAHPYHSKKKRPIAEQVCQEVVTKGWRGWCNEAWFQAVEESSLSEQLAGSAKGHCTWSATVVTIFLSDWRWRSRPTFATTGSKTTNQYQPFWSPVLFNHHYIINDISWSSMFDHFEPFLFPVVTVLINHH